MEMNLPQYLPVRSRAGNWIIAVLGAFIALAAAALLIYSIITTWGYAGRIDQLIWLMLVGTALAGAILALMAWRRLH